MVKLTPCVVKGFKYHCLSECKTKRFSYYAKMFISQQNAYKDCTTDSLRVVSNVFIVDSQTQNDGKKREPATTPRIL